MALTDMEIRKAKPKEKPYRMSDGGGTYLWVTPAGGKLWRWAYVYEGKEKLMALGKYPAVPLALARDRHLEGRKLPATAIDPMAQRKTLKTAIQVASENSFASVSGGWLDRLQEGESLRHVDSTRRRLSTNIFPLWVHVRSRRSRLLIWSRWSRSLRDVVPVTLQTCGRDHWPDLPMLRPHGW